MRKHHRRWKITALAALAAAPVVKAQTFTWTGLGSDNLWNDLANWDAGIPATGNTAQFVDAGNGNTNVSLGGAAQSINTILFNGTPASFNLGVTPGDVFNFDADGAITVNAGVTNGQTISAGILTNGSLTITNNVLNGATSGNGLTGLTINAVTIGGGGTLNILSTVTNTTTVLNGVIADGTGGPGSVSIVMNNGSTTTNTNLVINGFNTYSGTTSLTVNTGTNGGAIQIATDSPFGTGKVVNNLGTGANSPVFMALNGTRTLANAFDLNGGMTFIGSNGFTFTGPMNVLNAGRTVNNNSSAVLTLGSAASPSTITLGNPVANGGDGVGKNLTLTVQNGAGKIIVNDVLQDPGTGTGTNGGGSVSYSAVSGGVIVVNSLNTYTGNTSLNGNSGSTIQFDHSYNLGDPSGPFGLGTLVFNNTSNNNVQPVGGDRTLANPIQLNFGYTFNNAAGDTSSLTLTGPMTMGNAGRTLTNSMANGATLTLGSAASPSTLTLPMTNGANTVITGTGRTVINDAIVNAGSGTWVGTVSFTGTGAIIDNGALPSAGTVSIGGNGTFTFNAPIATTAITVGGGTPTTSTFNAPIGGTTTVNVTAAGTLNLNAQNTYSGGTTLNAAAIINIPNSTVVSGGNIVSGPFGTGSITFNNTSVSHLRPIGNQTIANPLLLPAGLAMDNAPGDTSSLTLTGPVTLTTTTGRFITNGFTSGTGGGTLFMGSAAAPSTITLATPASGAALSLAGVSGPIVVNDVIQNGTIAGSVNINPNAANINSITLNAQNTYTGGTTIGGGANGGGNVLIGASSVGAPGAITSGPFGTGTIVMNQTSQPPILTPSGADRTVANAITMTSGFFVTNSDATPLNLSLTGPITLGSASRTITNNMDAGAALTLGSAASPSTITLGNTTNNVSLQLQSQIGPGTTVINDVVQDNGTGIAGGLIVASGNVTLNAANTYSGGTTVNGGTLGISSDANLGAASGTVTVGAGTLLSTGAVTSARSVNLSDPAATLDATAGNSLALTGALTDAGTFTKGSNAGTVQLAQPAGYSTTNVNVNGGTLAIGGASGATGPLSVGGTLNVADGAKVAVLQAATPVANTVNNLNLNTSGTLDLANHSLLVTTTSNVASYVARAAGPVQPNGLNAWTGSGLTSSLVQADAATGNTKQLAVGYFDSRDNANTGLSVPAGQTLVKETVYGDATGDGKVNIADLSVWNNNFGASSPRWSQGDFNYDGKVNIADLSVWNNNFGGHLSGPTPPPAGAVAAAASVKLTSSASAEAATPPAGTLELDIDPTTGDAKLNSGGLGVAAIEIDSASGILLPAGWKSLKNNYGYTQWAFPRGTPNSSQIAEFVSDPSPSGQPANLAAGTVIDYGDIFPVGFTNVADLTFSYNLITDPSQGLTATRTGVIVVPEPTGLALAAVAAAGLLTRKRRRAV